MGKLLKAAAAAGRGVRHSVKNLGKRVSDVKKRSLDAYKKSNNTVSSGSARGTPDIFSMDMDVYKRNLDVHKRNNTMKSLVKAKNSSGSFKPGQVQTTIKAKASQAAKSIAAAGRGARKGVKNFGKTISGMGSRDSYVNSRDGTALIPGGKTLGAVNNSGSEYKKTPSARAVRSSKRIHEFHDVKLRKTNGGGERKNPNLGRVLGAGEKPRRKSRATGQVDSV